MAKHSASPPGVTIDWGPLEWSLLDVSTNVVCVLVLVFCSFVVARYAWPNRRRFQFSLASLMGLVTVTAIMCSIVKYEHHNPMTWLRASFVADLGAYCPITRECLLSTAVCPSRRLVSYRSNDRS